MQENKNKTNKIDYKNLLINIIGTTILISVIFLPIILVEFNKAQNNHKETGNYNIQGAYKIDKEYEKYGQRNAGTLEAQESRTWIESYLNYWGYDYQEFEFQFPVSASDYRYIPGANVQATGTDIIFEKAGASEKTILISAHYDSNPALYGTDGTAFSDNGSGTAVVLELAQLLTVIDSKNLPYTVRFGLWDAEEHGEYGGAAYAEWLASQENNDNVILDINLDTPVGGNYTYLEAPGQGAAMAGEDAGANLGTKEGYAVSAGLRNAVQDAAEAVGYPTYTTPSYSHRNDDPVNPEATQEGDPSYGMYGIDEQQNYHTYGNGFNYTTAFTGTDSGYAGEGYPASDWVAFMQNGIPCMGIESTNYRIDYSWNLLGDGYPQLYEEEAWTLMTKNDFVNYWTTVYESYPNKDAIPQNRLYSADSELTPYSGYGFTEAGQAIDFGKASTLDPDQYLIDQNSLEQNLKDYYDAEYAGYLDPTLQIDNPTGQPFPYELALQNNDYRPGATWHTQYDNSEWYDKNIGIENMIAQFTMVVSTLMEFILNADSYLENYSNLNSNQPAANTGSDWNYDWDYINS